jgi:hypothetical protein
MEIEQGANKLPDEHQVAFLRNMLAANPQDDARKILRQRAMYLENPDIVLAEVIDDESYDPRVRAQMMLNEVRDEFWTMDQQRLYFKLRLLSQSGFADIVAATRKLEALAAQRESLMGLPQSYVLDLNFYTAFCRVLTASPAEANQIREQQLRWMRPENNPAYLTANHAIKHTAGIICNLLPAVYQIEASWLNEILDFDPAHEMEDQSYHSMLGFGLLFEFFLLVSASIVTIRLMFGFE